MLCIIGNKQVNLDRAPLLDKCALFTTVTVDFGTGDGAYVYKQALARPTEMFIGVDTLAAPMGEDSKKAVRKKLINVLFAVGSLDSFPTELQGVADRFTVLFPWGELLKAIVSSDPKFVSAVNSCLKTGGELELVLGYSADLEPVKSVSLGLPVLTFDYLKSELSRSYGRYGLVLVEVTPLTAMEVKRYGTSWSKKIYSTLSREIFRVRLFKN